jgi:peptidoglycan/LPS O-acetylase OafA/YrhL
MFDTMFTTGERERHRIKSLDGLRALAIALVIAFHTLITFYLAARKGVNIEVFGSTHVTWFFMNCWTGVNLFFVLSGFLIAKQLVEIFSEPPAWHGILLARYARKRFCRIAPAYYVVTIPSLMTMHGLHGIPHAEWPFVLATYVLFMQDYFYQTLLQQLWSLGVEVKFYMIAPALVMLIGRLQLNARYVTLGVIIIFLLLMKVVIAWAIPPVTSEPSYVINFRTPFHMSLDSLIAGVAACFLWYDERCRRLLNVPLVANILFAAGTLSFLLLCAFTTPHYLRYPEPVTLFSETLFFTLVSVSFAAMLLGLLGPCAIAPLFASWPVRIVAELSYSLYLVHLLFVKRALTFAHDSIPDPSNQTMLWCSSIICLLVYAVPIAAIIYVFVERPINRWAHKPTRIHAEFAK